jgi:DNA-binding Xre family transcriptional regulator
LYLKRPAAFYDISGYRSNANFVFENRGLSMAVSYNKLWNLVRQNKMKKADLARAAEISEYAMKKLNRDEPVQLEILLRVCKVFHCDIGDLMEVIEE